MAYPASGAQLLFESTSVSLMVSGTPAAVLPVLMLVRISLRTIPERVSTFTVWFDEFAFEPSAGYGPPVSCGISATQVVIGVAVALVVGVAVALVVAVAVGVAVAPGPMISGK